MATVGIVALIVSTLAVGVVLRVGTLDGDVRRGASGSDGSPPDKAVSDHRGLPDQGMYDSCAPVPTATSGTAKRHCDANANLDTMAAAGFKLVLNYDLLYASIGQVKDYVSHASSVGMKVMISLHDPVWWTGNARETYSALAATCGCSTNATFVQYIVGALKDQPGTWGYYLGDEVSTDIVSAMNHWSIVHAADPRKPTFVVSAEDEASLGKAMTSVADAATVSILAPDMYPIGRNADISKDPLSAVGTTVGNVNALAKARGKETGVVLQSYNWKKMYPEEQFLAVARFPTRSEMRAMRDDAIAHAPLAFILWYSYFDLMNDLPWEQHWADLRWAAFEH